MAEKRVYIEPVTRVEGHGKVSIYLDDDNNVTQARMHVVEFRGFERFVQGRPYWEVPSMIQRLCGICPVSHHLCAAKAMDIIVGATQLSPVAEKMRRLMHYGQTYQSHALHFFHLSSPDLLFGFDADPAIRNVIGVATKFPELGVQAIKMRAYGQEVIKATSGKRIHGTGAVPGGINKNLAIEERDNLLKDIDQMMAWGESAVKIAKDYTVDNLEMLAPFGSFDSNHGAITQADGTLDLYDGKFTVIDSVGNKILDQMDPMNYVDHIQEEVRDWSYMKFPFLRSIGPENGWYRVGPLSRINICTRIDTPKAEAARQEFMAVTDGKPNNITMAYHWARMIELLHSIEKIEELLNDPDLQGTDLVVKGERQEEAVGVIEAPRGTLWHHYKVNDRDQVTMANLIVSTTQNNEPMNRSVQKVAQDHISGKAEITEGMLNRIEVAIRAYDPCLSCATHALGHMPLEVELIGADGELIEKKTTN